VTAAAVDAPKPAERPGDAWENAGYLARVDYHELDPPIPRTEIPVEWRRPGPGPFTQDGNVKQGYLFPLTASFFPRLIEQFKRAWPDFARMPLDGGTDVDPPSIAPDLDYIEPPFAEIAARINAQGLRLDARTLRRYHLGLKTRGFVVLSGLSGTGKTWLAEAYATAVGARHAVVPVAPNWTTNEDLLGYANPLSGAYHDTSFGRFLREAADAWELAKAAGITARPYHVVLDEMNLARVEYYFARFLSAMEVRARAGSALMELGPDDAVLLTPNLAVIGTVNLDETTHGFADKVYDRAQLVELEARREDLAAHLSAAPYRDDLLAVWDAVRFVGPFTFRVLDEIAAYVASAVVLAVPWEEALDEQLLQKVLPKLKGADPAIGEALIDFLAISDGRFPLSHRRAAVMLDGFQKHGFASYFR
jgi:hypothetical protein